MWSEQEEGPVAQVEGRTAWRAAPPGQDMTTPPARAAATDHNKTGKENISSLFKIIYNTHCSAQVRTTYCTPATIILYLLTL